jgi:hypothetical protein
MSAIIGLAMMFAAILIGRAAKIGIPMQPPPWWATDNMSAFAISPGIVTLFAGGMFSFGAWVLSGGWRSNLLVTALGLAAAIAAYVALGRAIRAWAARVAPANAEVVRLTPGTAGDDPRQPPRMPPMKKAA